MALPVTITGISTAVACVGPYKSSHSPSATLIPSSFSSGAFLGQASSNERRMQSYTVGGSQIVGTSIRAPFSKNGNPADNFYCEIYAADGSHLPTGSVIATSDNVAGASLPAGDINWITFNFASGYTLSASIEYCFVFRRTGAVDSSNYYQYWGPNASISSTAWSSVYSGSWGAASANDFGLAIGDQEAVYFFGRDDGTSADIECQKATDPTSSFSTAGTNNNIGTAGTKNGLAGYANGDAVNLTAHDGSACGFNIFDLSTDGFGTAEIIVSGVTTNGQTGSPQPGCSIVVRSTDEAVAFFNGAQTKKSGTNYARVYWSRRTGVNTWSAAALVSAEDAADHIKPNAVLGASDRVHFLWTAANGRPTHRSLSSANTLDTNSGDLSVGDIIPSLRGAISYDDAGTVRIIFAYTEQNGRCAAINTDSGANPTWTTTITVELGVLVRSPTRLFNDGTDAYVLYAETDNDLYTEKSTDDGDTWGTKTLAFTATITEGEENLSHDGNIYQRGSDLVIPYVVNDNGTLKYNEYIVRTIVAAPNNGWIDDPWRANDVVAKRDFRAMAYQ